KRTQHLARLQAIEATGRATVLVDQYDDDDWSRLWWIRVEGRAVVHQAGSAVDGSARAALVAKYRQYAERPAVGPVDSVALDSVGAWRADQAGVGRADRR